jgi:hypothetical protein
MSDDVDDEVVEPVTVGVRVDHYNELMDAADLGFEILVMRRMALAKLMNDMGHHPERDASKMKAESLVCVRDIPLMREDVVELWRRADAKVKRVADALNSRFAPGVTPRYKS